MTAIALTQGNIEVDANAGTPSKSICKPPFKDDTERYKSEYFKREAYTQSAEYVLKSLKSDKEKGLTEREAKIRIDKHGKNEISEPEQESLLRRVWGNFTEPLNMVLLGSSAVSATLGNLLDGMGILGAIGLSTGISYVQDRNAENAFLKLKEKSENKHLMAKVIRNGEGREILRTNVTIGDIIKLEKGDIVPADARIIKSGDLKLNEKELTGESRDVSKRVELDKDCEKKECISLSDKRNMVFAGTIVVGGEGLAVVTAVGNNTEAGRSLLEVENGGKTPLKERLELLAKNISIVSFVSAGSIFLLEAMRLSSMGMLKGGTWRALNVLRDPLSNVVALIVAAVPEGLPTMLASTLALNAWRMSENNLLVRKNQASEAIGSIDVLCSDKTGTLTQGKMEVKEIVDFCKGEELYIKKGDKFIKEHGGLSAKDLLEFHEDNEITKNYCLNTSIDTKKVEKKIEGEWEKENNTILEEEFIGSDTELPLVKITNNIGMYNNIRGNYKKVNVLKYDSDRKMMSTVVERDGVNTIYSKGAPEKILGLCKWIVWEGKIRKLTPDIEERIREKIVSMESKALRVLAFAHRNDVEERELARNLLVEKAHTCAEKVESAKNSLKDKTYTYSLESDLIFDGFVGMEDPLREGVAESIKKCEKAGIKVKILTGDSIGTAEAIAGKLGILSENSKIRNDEDIQGMTDDELKEELENIVLVARCTPGTKKRVVKLLKDMGHSVAVTGDGVNDTPALSMADIGVAMGSGHEMAKEVAGIVVLDDERPFDRILEAINWGRGIYENIQRFLQYQLSVSLVAFTTTFFAARLGFAVPFNTLQLLWINLIMDGPPALTLGLEPIRDNLFEKSPVDRKASILTRGMIASIMGNSMYMFGSMMAIIGTNFFGLAAASQMPTVIFTSFVLFQFWNAFNCREFGKDSVINNNFWKNKLMLKANFAVLLTQIAIVQLGGPLFGTVPLGLALWSSIILSTSSVVIFKEWAKEYLYPYGEKAIDEFEKMAISYFESISKMKEEFYNKVEAARQRVRETFYHIPTADNTLA